MYILIIIKDGKRHVYAENGMTRLFDSWQEALETAEAVYGCTQTIKFESVLLTAEKTAHLG